MGSSNPELAVQKATEQIVGYLNFSSGSEDASFAKNLNRLFCFVSSNVNDTGNCACVVFERLNAEISRLACTADAAMCRPDQARFVLELTSRKLLPAYLAYHRDLMFHQDRGFLFNSFFSAKAFEAVLQAGPPWDEADRIIQSALEKLNDYLGHRPVAILESQKIEPYAHEWIAPVPVYLKGVGVAAGRYQELIELAIETLRDTDPVILRDAHFSLDRLQELAIDPRSFDFDHPINKRPNHHFGQWDEHSIDSSGFYNRFIVHQVTLDALLGRVERRLACKTDVGRDQLLLEAGSVLACTILMSSGISGQGPGSFDSNTTLATLLPTIAGYRDQFYSDLMKRLPANHRQRLVLEAESRRQPFGSARQDLNNELDRRRASQLVNCRLASIFARMGFSEAAVEQSQVVPVASARILCQIDCLLSSAHQATKRGKLADAFQIMPRVVELLKDGVECGAIVDPWNILGFDANYSLFPATENSVADHRVYELVDLVERILGMCSSIWSEAAAVDDLETCQAISQEFEGIVQWWRKYAAHEVMAVDAVDPEEIFGAAELVARALNLWQKGGAAAGDLEFWKPHADLFDSPKAYHLVIEALMDRGDYQTSSALLVHWLSQSEFVRLQHGDSSFHNLIWRWINEQKGLLKTADIESGREIWNRIRKFIDYLEANAESYGEIPDFEIGRALPLEIADGDCDNSDELGDSNNDLYDAAYDDVSYRDTTDDGIEGSIYEPDGNSDDELEAEVDRVFDRLEFLATMANFWRTAATFPLPVKQGGLQLSEAAAEQLKNRRDILAGWIARARSNRSKLTTLLNSVFSYRIPNTGVDHESLMQYDRHRLYKESLLERIVTTCVESEQAVCMLAAVIAAIDHLVEKKAITDMPADVGDKGPLVSLFAAILITDIALVKQLFPDAIRYLHSQRLLHVPLSRGGKPNDIVNVRVVQEEIRDLAGSLPLLGLFVETHELMTTALAMERNHKAAHGAVTEFDDLFKVAYTSMVKCLIQSTQLLQQTLEVSGEFDNAEAAAEADSVLFECIQMVTESMQMLWLSHSRTLRLSVLEKLEDEKAWSKMVDFIQRYGSGLFTQQFLQLSNARAILHQTVSVWLDNVLNSPTPVDLRLFDELDKAIPKKKAASFLTLILEAICENYNEYRDYNTTTTQSDHGEMLFTLLDFLRLRGKYDRVCWYLKPIVWGHEILVRDGQNAVARMWRRSLTQKIGPEADKYLAQLEVLRNKYSIQMASVGRRLEGRFIHPMQIDRLRSLVRPAMAKPDSRKSKRKFELLQQETQAFSRATAGVGLDLPAWLAALENEVQQFLLPLRLRSKNRDQALIHPIDVPVSRLREELEQLPQSEP